MAAAHIELRASDGDDFATVLVDLDTYERLNGRSLSIGSHGYAQLWERPRVMLLHRWAMDVQPGTGYRVIVDHINRQVLDCRRSNLRLVTPSASNLNRSVRPRDLPVGVYRTRGGRFTAGLQRNRRMIHLGTFNTPEEAAATVAVARADLDRNAFATASA